MMYGIIHVMYGTHLKIGASDPDSLNLFPDPGFAEFGSNPDSDPDPDKKLVGPKNAIFNLLKPLKRTLWLHEKPTTLERALQI